MSQRPNRLRKVLFSFVLTFVVVALSGSDAAAQVFKYEMITELPGGPGAGNYPSINDIGGVAFFQDYNVYVYDKDLGSFLNINSLPGAPTQGWFPKINNLGNVVFGDTGTDDLWFYDAAGQALTNISSLVGYPGNSQAHDIKATIDLNDSNQVSFHSGDRNVGDVYVYDHATGDFLNVTDQPGGAGRGRDTAINNVGQVAYGGFPDIYVYDMGTGTTTNITDLPGGPGTGLGAFSFNDMGDIAIFRPDCLIYYKALTGTFVDISALPGFPVGAASSTANDISERGEITFWRDGIYYFDPLRQTFTQLNGQGSVPSGGLGSSINDKGEIAFGAGNASVEDIFIATLVVPVPPTGLRIRRSPGPPTYRLLRSLRRVPTRPRSSFGRAEALKGALERRSRGFRLVANH